MDFENLFKRMMQIQPTTAPQAGLHETGFLKVKAKPQFLSCFYIYFGGYTCLYQIAEKEENDECTIQ